MPTAAAAFWPNVADGRKMARDLLVSEDGRTAGMVAWLRKSHGPRGRRKVVEQIESIAAELDRDGFRLRLAGTPVMNVALDRTSERASKTFLPLAIAVSVLVLIVSLRSGAAVTAAMLSVGSIVAATVGLMAVAGRSMNMVTVALPSLLFVLAISNAIHISSRFTRHRGEGMAKREAIRSAIRKLIRPATLSSVTTAVGFSSLLLSEMSAVADLGLFAAAGMIVSLAWNLTVLPAALSILPSRPAATDAAKTRAHWSGRSAARISRRWPIVAAVSTLIVVGCAVTVSRIRVESNVLTFLPKDSKTARDYAFIADRLTGVYTVELSATVPTAEEPNLARAFGELAVAAEGHPDVARVAYYRPTLTRLSGLARRFRHEADGRVSLRMSVLVRSMSSRRFYELTAFLRSQADRQLGSGQFTLTGVVPLLNDAQASLVQTQVRSFSLAAGVVLVMIGLLFRSARAALAAVVPNLLPVGMAMAVMVVGGIALNAATVMIASVAIGIAADDTIHFLSRYRLEMSARSDAPSAASATLAGVGREIVFTSIVAAAGFAVLCLAEFRPLVHFGLLTSVTMLVALAGDLFVLPATARVFRLWEKK